LSRRRDFLERTLERLAAFIRAKLFCGFFEAPRLLGLFFPTLFRFRIAQ
jgi:hypothetical protein